MKKILLICCLIYNILPVECQSIFDNFENGSCEGNTGSDIFLNYINHSPNTTGCLPGWHSSHGSPNTFGPNDYIAPIPTFNNFTELKTRLTGKCLNLFWSSSQKAEGAVRAYNFNPNTCYRVRFKVCATMASGDNAIPSTIRIMKILAVKDMPTKGCCIAEEPTPSIPSSNTAFVGQKEYPTSSLSTQSFTQWETVDYFFTTQRSDLNSVWIYPEVAGGGTLILAIDDFSIEETCLQDIYLSQTNIVYSNVFKASNSITVGSSSGFVSFSSSNSTLLQAGNYILLDKGTNIPIPDASRVFVAQIGTCPTSSCPIQSLANNNGMGSNSTTIKKSENKLENNLSKENILIYPNPNDGEFQIYTNDFDASELRIEVIDILGKVIFTSKIEESGQKFKLDDKFHGIYFVKILSQDKAFTYKLLKN